LQLDGVPDDVLTVHEFDVVQSLPDSPTSASAMLTFADIVAASTVKTWENCRDGDRDKCVQPDDSSSSSDGSAVTATTVRTVVIKSNVFETADARTPSNSNSTTEMPDVKDRKPVSSSSRSTSRPASAQPRQLTTAGSSRARSVSQPRPQPNASNSVSAGTRNVKSRSPRLNRQPIR